MYLVIIGGGRVGYYLSKALLEEGHEIVVIEKDATVCNIINDELGTICLHGDGCEAAVLEEAGTERADMIVAVTGDDEDNLVACQVAKHKFNVPRTISRIRNPKNEILFEKLGIDITIDNTNIMLEYITEAVPTHHITHLMTVTDKGLELVEVKIPATTSNAGKKISQLNLPEGTQLVLIIGKDKNPIVPGVDTIVEGGVQIIAVTPPEKEEELRKILRG